MTPEHLPFLKKYYTGKVIPVDKVWDKMTWKGTITIKDFEQREDRLLVIVFIKILVTTQYRDGKDSHYISINNGTLPSLLYETMGKIRDYFHVTGQIYVQDPQNIDSGFVWVFGKGNTCSGRFVNEHGVRITEKQYRGSLKK
jgi:hypothetical protein